MRSTSSTSERYLKTSVKKNSVRGQKLLGGKPKPQKVPYKRLRLLNFSDTTTIHDTYGKAVPHTDTPFEECSGIRTHLLHTDVVKELKKEFHVSPNVLYLIVI